MKRLLLLAVLVLSACVPTLTEDSSRVAFTCVQSECVITADAPITEAYVGLEGPVSSRYCMGEVTAQPRPCVPVVGAWRALDVPPGNYGLRLVVGRIDKPPAAGFADVNLAGARESFRVELTP